jgi:hypothetical protein
VLLVPGTAFAVHLLETLAAEDVVLDGNALREWTASGITRLISPYVRERSVSAPGPAARWA